MRLADLDAFYSSSKFSVAVKQKELKNVVIQAKALRNELRNLLAYGLRHQPEKQKKARRLGQSTTQMGIVQDLGALSLFGQAHHHLLDIAVSGMAIYEQADTMAKVLANALAQGAKDRVMGNQYRIYRDKAYYDVKKDMDELRAIGRFVFSFDKKKRKAYASDYHRKNKLKAKRAAAAKQKATEKETVNNNKALKKATRRKTTKDKTTKSVLEVQEAIREKILTPPMALTPSTIPSQAPG